MNVARGPKTKRTDYSSNQIKLSSIKFLKMISYKLGAYEHKLKSPDMEFLHSDNKSEFNDFKLGVKGFTKQKVVISLVGKNKFFWILKDLKTVFWRFGKFTNLCIFIDNVYEMFGMME